MECNAKLSTEDRPGGLVQPAHERALSALRALDDGRLADAEGHVAAIPDSPMIQRAWKLYLSGMALIGRERFREAESSLLQASSLALIWGGEPGDAPDLDAFRLSARALHHVGWIYRRQDRPDDAYRTHLIAYRVRDRHGSFDELWETAIELGLDCDLARRFDQALDWHRAAVHAADRASIQPARKRAMAWTGLSTSCMESGRHDEAVSAARAARDLWREHDITAVTAAHADLQLGGALLKQGEMFVDQHDRRSEAVLNEAMEWLSAARDALLAFGPRCAADAESAGQRMDFAKRLLASLGT